MAGVSACTAPGALFCIMLRDEIAWMNHEFPGLPDGFQHCAAAAAAVADKSRVIEHIVAQVNQAGFFSPVQNPQQLVHTGGPA
jgi:hypothetical protein